MLAMMADCEAAQTQQSNEGGGGLRTGCRRWRLRQSYGGEALSGQRRPCICGAQVAAHRRWRGIGGAFLLSGQRLFVQVGDVSNSRKAWKKRQRNVSPILAPCSILGVDRANSP